MTVGNGGSSMHKVSTGKRDEAWVGMEAKGQHTTCEVGCSTQEGARGRGGYGRKEREVLRCDSNMVVNGWVGLGRMTLVVHFLCL